MSDVDCSLVERISIRYPQPRAFAHECVQMPILKHDGAFSPSFDSSSGPAEFPTTVHGDLEKARSEDDEDSRRGLERFFAAYLPVFESYFSRRVLDRSRASDLRQAFCEHILAHDVLRKFVPREGVRFRNFLSRCLKNFLCDYARARTAAPSATTESAVSLDALQEFAGFDPVDEDSWDASEALLDAPLAIHLHSEATAGLREVYASHGKAAWFDALMPTLFSTLAGLSYVELANRLGTSPSALKQEKHRLSQAYCELFRAKVAQFTPSADVAEEVRHLLNILRKDQTHS